MGKSMIIKPIGNLGVPWHIHFFRPRTAFDVHQRKLQRILGCAAAATCQCCCRWSLPHGWCCHPELKVIGFRQYNFPYEMPSEIAPLQINLVECNVFISGVHWMEFWLGGSIELQQVCWLPWLLPGLAPVLKISPQWAALPNPVV